MITATVQFVQWLISPLDSSPEAKASSFKALCRTQWECQVDALKAVLYQLPEMWMHRLPWRSMQKRRRILNSERSFLVSTNVWYNVLYFINRVRSCSASVFELVHSGKRSQPCQNNLNSEKFQVEVTWLEVQWRKTKRQFDYEGREETANSSWGGLQKRVFFLHLVETAVVTLRRDSHTCRPSMTCMDFSTPLASWEPQNRKGSWMDAAMGPKDGDNGGSLIPVCLSNCPVTDWTVC